MKPKTTLPPPALPPPSVLISIAMLRTPLKIVAAINEWRRWMFREAKKWLSRVQHIRFNENAPPAFASRATPARGWGRNPAGLLFKRRVSRHSAYWLGILRFAGACPFVIGLRGVPLIVRLLLGVRLLLLLIVVSLLTLPIVQRPWIAVSLLALLVVVCLLIVISLLTVSVFVICASFVLPLTIIASRDCISCQSTDNTANHHAGNAVCRKAADKRAAARTHHGTGCVIVSAAVIGNCRACTCDKRKRRRSRHQCQMSHGRSPSWGPAPLVANGCSPQETNLDPPLFQRQRQCCKTSMTSEKRRPGDRSGWEKISLVTMPILRPKIDPRDPAAFAVAPPVRPGRGGADCAVFQEAPVVAPPSRRRSPSSARYFDDRVGVRRLGTHHFRRQQSPERATRRASGSEAWPGRGCPNVPHHARRGPGREDVRW